MNREIKFRAWHKLNSEMLHEGWNGDNFVSKGELFGYGESAEIMQYTGLKDKNGVEIYEGDLLKGLYTLNGDSSPVFVVGFIKGCSSIAYLDREELNGDYERNTQAYVAALLMADDIAEEMDTWQYLGYALDDMKYEVTGNIYQSQTQPA